MNASARKEGKITTGALLFLCVRCEVREEGRRKKRNQ
jgi:hypothetical protein